MLPLTYLVFLLFAISASATSLHKQHANSTVQTDLEVVDEAIRALDYNVKMLLSPQTQPLDLLELTTNYIILIQAVHKGTKDNQGAPTLTKEETSKLPTVPALDDLKELLDDIIKQKPNILALWKDSGFIEDSIVLLDDVVESYIESFISILPAEEKPTAQEWIQEVSVEFEKVIRAFLGN